ncbi:hypothetical protein LguiB_011634 [Lonicera macranthoides]
MINTHPSKSIYPYSSSISTATASTSTSSNASSSSSSTHPKPPPPPDHHLDCHLAGAGNRVRSSDLRQVAHPLEHVETAMCNSPINHLVVNDAVHYNPSDLSSWIDSVLSELDQPLVPAHLSDPDLTFVPRGSMDYHAPQHNSQLRVEEDSGIRLVNLMLTCADYVQRGEVSLAGSLVEESRVLLARVNHAFGIYKVAAYFIDALSRRIFKPPPGGSLTGSAYDEEILYHHFYEACPYLKFAHFTANQAILEAFDGHDCVHVIDFNLMHGLQWPDLIQALALRPGGPPLLRLTGIGPPSPDGRNSLREIGLRLSELARSVNVRFNFRGVTASRIEDVKPWMLQVSQKEVLAVNSIMQFHKLLGSDSSCEAPIGSVLRWIRGFNPKIITIIEQEANHNQPGFLDRFTEALYYYSTIFDSLEAGSIGLAQLRKGLAEVYIQKEIRNVVCCEGSARVERHEPLAKWRDRLIGVGFKPVNLGSNAFKQASMLLTLFFAEGYCVEENEGSLMLGWHSRPLIAASAWQVEPVINQPLGVINNHSNDIRF